MIEPFWSMFKNAQNTYKYLTDLPFLYIYPAWFGPSFAKRRQEGTQFLMAFLQGSTGEA